MPRFTHFPSLAIAALFTMVASAQLTPAPTATGGPVPVGGLCGGSTYTGPTSCANAGGWPATCQANGDVSRCAPCPIFTCAQCPTGLTHAFTSIGTQCPQCACLPATMIEPPCPVFTCAACPSGSGQAITSTGSGCPFCTCTPSAPGISTPPVPAPCPTFTCPGCPVGSKPGLTSSGSSCPTCTCTPASEPTPPTTEIVTVPAEAPPCPTYTCPACPSGSKPGFTSSGTECPTCTCLSAGTSKSGASATASESSSVTGTSGSEADSAESAEGEESVDESGATSGIGWASTFSVVVGLVSAVVVLSRIDIYNIQECQVTLPEWLTGSPAIDLRVRQSGWSLTACVRIAQVTHFLHLSFFYLASPRIGTSL
ncbi:hypothetical protein CC2G_006560 [Coprinopsis cinerea AmutBmut pab1-1]|nr:hypothetical protein CC2G_006560 [Coprinopsis cinerea AmutBmut pab1-1]